ncbi:Uncharacterised protein [Yersinia intermedia]|mgnify:FL=1|uniref:hypothetical protein n=1 Tax=Yersinia intermedia TaxID=631 RepID=UPI0005DF4741|nr:hypothetical protein [Yersinia intermedia]WET16905.1 hypothetical protein P2W49_11170 [Yersinia intermedia]CNB48268.1 Uncharacterised protein [Yersinia intermedia]CNF86403.1 Uncharacterised protein [Yersinia intermedia]
MKKRHLSLLLGWVFCGAAALTMSQTVQAVEAYNQLEHPVYSCVSCYYPLVWF